MSESLFITVKRLFIVAFICGLVSLAAGCTTTYDEWAGKMANEKPAQSVRGDQQRREQRDQNDQRALLPHSLHAVAPLYGRRK
jgi:hypothetical protein